MRKIKTIDRGIIIYIGETGATIVRDSMLDGFIEYLLEKELDFDKKHKLEKILGTKDPDIKKLLWLQYKQLNNEKDC